MARNFVEKTNSESKLQDLTIRILALLDNAYDRVFWPSLMQSLENNLLDKLLRGVLKTLQAGQSIPKLITENGPTWGLKDEVLNQWRRIAEFLQE
jgi:hypothetical protein